MNLDFSIRSPRPGLVSWALLALGLALSGWAVQAWQEADMARSAAEHHLASLQAKSVAVVSGKPASAARQSDAMAARVLSRQRDDDAARSQMNLPWQRLIATLQTSRPSEIALLSLDADGRRGDFTLTALARNHSAMLSYFDELQRSPGLLQVSLNRHEERDMDGISTVYFSLRGEWAQP